MARAPRQSRAAAETDLSDRQRRIYNALPDDLKRQYLTDLPPINLSPAGRMRKASMIRKRLELVDDVISGLQNHRRRLTQMAKGLEQGQVSADSVDLRQELKPPALAGVTMRYARGQQSE